MGTVNGEYSSFCGYSGNVILNVRRYNLHTKIAISTTLILLVVSATLFFLFEKDKLMARYGNGRNVIIG